MINAQRSGGVSPLAEEESSGMSGFNGEEILVIGIRGVGEVLWHAWTEFVASANRLLAGFGLHDSALGTDGMSQARALIVSALSKSNLSQADKDTITQGVIDKLLDSGVIGAELGALNNLIGLSIRDVPGLTVDNKPALAVTRPSDSSSGRSVEMELDLGAIKALLTGHNGQYDNNVERVMVHELLHAVNGSGLTHTLPPPAAPGQTPDDAYKGWVMAARGYDGNVNHAWVLKMDALGNAMGLITNGNHDAWIPIVVDVAGSGPKLIGKDASNVSIDISGTGTKVATGWIGPGQGLLVADWNKNSNVDSGQEISFARFASDKTSDISGLASFDQNHDGRIDAKDEIFNVLKLWMDSNKDGISQPSELQSLKDAGIESIGLNVRNYHQEKDGNVISHVVDVQLTSGAHLQAYDVGFGV